MKVLFCDSFQSERKHTTHTNSLLYSSLAYKVYCSKHNKKKQISLYNLTYLFPLIFSGEGPYKLPEWQGIAQ